MPSASLERRVKQLLAESRDSTRFVEFAMVVRRCTLSIHVPEGSHLVDDVGREWIADEVAADGLQPVFCAKIGQSAGAREGDALRWEGGQVELVTEDIVTAGGVWDRQKRAYRVDEAGKRIAAENPVVVDLIETQIESARWFRDRLAAFKTRKPHPQSVGELFADRRAGKTYVCVLFILLTLIDVPAVDGGPTIAWLVSKQHNVREELDAIIRSVLPASYYTFREQPLRKYQFLNGSGALHKTVDDPNGALKAGRVDVALLNEAANLPFQAYRNILRATQDKQGFVLLATNTPTATRGAWVVKLADGIAKDQREGIVPAVQLFKLDPRKNVRIEQSARSVIERALLYALDDGEILDEGVILEADAKCYSPPWDDTLHQQPLPGPESGLVDVTATVTDNLFGSPFQYLVGADWQQRGPASIAFKIYARSTKPEHLADFRLYATHAWFLQTGGDEDDLLDSIEASGLRAGDCLVIGDCSGGWQSYSHDRRLPVSYMVYMRRGWTITGPSLKKTDVGNDPKNPPVEQSIGKLRGLIRESRFYVVPGDAAAPAAIALRKCEATVDRYKNLRSKGIHAHLGDCARYVAWYLLARPEVMTGAVGEARSFSGRRRR